MYASTLPASYKHAEQLYATVGLYIPNCFALGLFDDVIRVLHPYPQNTHTSRTHKLRLNANSLAYFYMIDNWLEEQAYNHVTCDHIACKKRGYCKIAGKNIVYKVVG